jgi:bacterial/archaeal transporter family protein
MMRTPSWFIPAVMALLLWGVWGILQKLATNHMPPRNVYLVSALGAIAVVLVIVATSRFPLSLSTEGTLFAVIAGICSALGGLLFLHAVSKGEASVVITFTALYPVVSIILSFVLFREAVTLKQGIGIVLALFSMVLLAG